MDTELLDAHTAFKNSLALKIIKSAIPFVDKESLCRRLEFASHEGVAAIVRDFDAAIETLRRHTLPSYRRRHEAMAHAGCSPMTKPLANFACK